jgi:maleylacetoacetate isomerase
MLTLYDDRRASAPYRIRIALNFKNLPYESVLISLAEGEQRTPAYRAINPQGVVPALETGHGILTQSLAILEWLEEAYPTPSLLPGSSVDRARIRALCAVIAADVHPLQSLRVRAHLTGGLNLPPDEVSAWLKYWIEAGLADFQTLLTRAPVQGRFCYGDQVSLADVMLVPQMSNARRFGCDLDHLQHLVAVDAALQSLPAFQKACP